MRTDVLILGGGLAAVTAAHTVLKNSGLSVAMAYDGSGASPHIHAFCLPVGPGDTVETFYRDSLISGCGQCDRSLVQRLCGDAPELISWLEALGCAPDREGERYRLLRSLGSSLPRIASIKNSTGPTLLARLWQELRACPRFSEMAGCRALSLIRRDGRVVGVRCFDTNTQCFVTLTAGVVILASGGFGRLFPQSTNTSDIGGDGIAMAYEAGAALTDLEFIQFEPSAALWPPRVAGKGIVTTMFYEGAVLRDREGRRFMDEQVSKDVMSAEICRHIRACGATEHGGVWFDATAVPEALWQSAYAPYLQRYLACGIDLRREPVEIGPAAHTTCGGVVIDRDCQTTVPGLLACGEVTGGLHGANRLGGNAGLEVLVFGRAAGSTAISSVESVAQLPEDPVPNGREPDQISELRDALGNALQEGLGVIREAEGLQRALKTLDGALAVLGEPHGSYAAHRLYNDLITAKAAAACALKRKGSVGCHIRSDSVPESPYRILAVLEQGEMVLHRCAV